MQSIFIRFPNIGDFSREWLEQNPESAQNILAKCKGEYPLCLCRQPNQKLYIAYKQSYYLARIPNTGPAHAPFCPSYEPDKSLCGRGIYTNSAIIEKPDGRVSVKLSVPLLIRNNTGQPPPSFTTDHAQTNAQKEEIKLIGLLHLLWEKAGFNRWSPKMKGKRHYQQVYKYMLAAGDTLMIRRTALTQHLYMPEPFKSENALEIEARRQKTLNKLSRTPRGAPKRILIIGQLKSFQISEYGIGIRLSHTPPEFIIWFSHETAKQFKKNINIAIQDWPAIASGFNIITILTMQRSNRGYWQANEINGMVTTKDYLPIESMEEAILIKHLIKNDRYFYKPLRYDSNNILYPNFLLIDSGDKAVPLEIFSNEKTADAIRSNRIAEYKENSMPYWQWDATQDIVLPTLSTKL